MLGIDWIVKDITNASLVMSPQSSFTACVNDIAVNETDLCIGDFW